MDDTGSVLLAFVTAAGLGAVIGLERQIHRHYTEDVSAGVRTYALFGLWGATTGFFAETYGAAAFVVGSCGLCGPDRLFLCVVCLGTKDWGITTEFASLGAFAVGVLVWNDQVIVASAIAIGIAALLRAKEWLHGLTDKFSDKMYGRSCSLLCSPRSCSPCCPIRTTGPSRLSTRGGCG